MKCKKCNYDNKKDSKYCENCGNKLDDFIIDIKLAKKEKLLKILGICAASMYVLSALVIFIGVPLCFPDPSTGKNVSGLSFDLFVMCGGILFVIYIILIILIFIINSKSK